MKCDELQITCVIFFALPPSRTTRALRSPHFHLCSPKTRKKLRLFCRLSRGRQGNVPRLKNARAKPLFFSLNFLFTLSSSPPLLSQLRKTPSVYSRPCCFGIQTRYTWTDYTYYRKSVIFCCVMPGAITLFHPIELFHCCN